ncbi:hypothetical protein ACTFIW_001123 [Dictyostelium discoideum]|uniref:Biogenesis of lysosome-related organelles complex 1 subunit 5 n=1 Tax=Dictyostelium discoideum TaxID=44689 RepID=BL1S5_DICDI|nr:hypothetical protein DDB_G0281859 [Dictyostelium discoideum AX4]Q54TC6.1 RecName: Full=Biogenesis of lysosome-related organelles complex 1 subunit 5; Short=BLOC-1 subunit 5; AltName: Full=Protein Muted homolog [Dictyostelium discoideum]EAL66489.1 hypothetical protein DDB_G0281859 [Dictyostelium discoideum AX4]|eukprot:XP_640463.1 hypothetical protein DDB_G0281859 [Dictyostelium discoideum AX4]
MNPKDKRVNFGSMEPLIRDIGTVYEFYFDQNTFIESEIKTFLKEFETKRGDRDLYSLSQQTINANNTIVNINRSIHQSSQFLENINNNLNQINSKLSTQVENESIHQEQRNNDRLNKFELELVEKKSIEDSFNQRKSQIENDFNEKASVLRDKYQIVL